jgi:hypothetical protein
VVLAACFDYALLRANYEKYIALEAAGTETTCRSPDAGESPDRIADRMTGQGEALPRQAAQEIESIVTVVNDPISSTE